jgi:DNA helicase-2/ATP-dependent DNA helicase PcrA
VGAPPPAGSFATAAVAGVAARLDRVLAWRRQQARAVGAPATAVLSDRATASIAEESPTSIAQLAALPGVGPLRAARVGPSLLAALAVSPDGDAGRHGR